MALKSSREDLFRFDAAQLSQARGALRGAMMGESFYRPLAKLWESERAYRQGIRGVCTHFVAQVEHILPRAPRGDWCRFFPDEDQRIDMRNRLGNLCLLSKDANFKASNKTWAEKRDIYSNEAPCFVSAHEIAHFDDWSPVRVEFRTREMAGGIVGLLDI